MTFDAPFGLLALAAVPVAWWIHRTRTGAPVVRVASLLAFRAAAPARPSSAPRRTADVPFVLTLAAMSLLAFAAAGPRFGGAGVASAYVVVDRSVSMTARTCDAERRLDEVLGVAAAGVVAEFHELAGAADGLPGSLAEHLERARAEGYPGVVVVTDARFAAVPGVACVGPTKGAVANVSVAGAVLDGEDAVVTLRDHGRAGAVVRVRSGDVEREADIPAGGVASVRFPAPARGERTTYAIVSPSDDLAADDRIDVVRRGGAQRVSVLAGGRACPRLEAAVRAACPGGVAAGEPDVEVTYRAAAAGSAAVPRFVVGATASADADVAPIRSTAASRTVRGDEIVGHGAAADVLPASGTSLVATGSLAGGEPLWSTADAVLLARTARLVVLAIDPEDPRSDWHRDPSFPALVASAIEALTDGPARLEPLSPVPASESDVVRGARPTSSPEEIRAVVRPPADAPGSVRPAPWIAGVSALLLAAAAAVARR